MTSRHHARRVEAIWSRGDAGGRLASPLVGVFRPALALRTPIVAGAALGTIAVLGQDIDVIAPAGTHGVITAVAGDGRATAPVAHGSALYVVDPDAAAVLGAVAAGGNADAAAGDGLVFTAPTSGRFYGRPGPGKAPFVSVDDVIGEGHTICMLEVMKTFNRVTYGGPGLPARARVTAILVADEADVDAGAALLRLDPA